MVSIYPRCLFTVFLSKSVDYCPQLFLFHIKPQAVGFVFDIFLKKLDFSVVWQLQSQCFFFPES